MLKIKFGSKSKKIASLLVKPQFPEDTSAEIIQQALNDCLGKVSSKDLEEQIKDVMQAIKSTEDPEKKKQLMQKFQELHKKKLQK